MQEQRSFDTFYRSRRQEREAMDRDGKEVKVLFGTEGRGNNKVAKC